MLEAITPVLLPVVCALLGMIASLIGIMLLEKYPHETLTALSCILLIVIMVTVVVQVTNESVAAYEFNCAPVCLNTTNTGVRMLNGTECWCMDGRPAMNATSGLT